jgi:hypothetical protein
MLSRAVDFAPSFAQQRVDVFISSTSQDLEDYRAVARLAVLDMGWRPDMMEHWGSSHEYAVPECLQRLELCQLVLLIVAFRKGWVPSVEVGGSGVDSVTSLEFAHAKARGIPVLVMLATDNWPGRLWESDSDKREWMTSFRAGVGEQPVMWFDPEPPGIKDNDRLPTFRAKVKQVLLDHRDRAYNAARASSSAGLRLDYFESAQKGLLEGSCLPFIGPAIHGESPLGSEALARALGKPEGDDRPSLATASEYRERYLGTRERFLKDLRQLLASQNGQAMSSPMLDLLVELDELSPLVSATCDEVLEAKLAAANKPFTVISHILRSADGRYDGKILVTRPGAEPSICLADEVDLRNAGRVIYKPLGSPFLNERMDDWDPSAEIDTVVVTESDHLRLLGRLEHQHARIPSALIRHFRRKPMLFLGWGLDFWQYRLVTHVFHALCKSGQLPPVLAVRNPKSLMEEVTWQSLGAHLVTLELPDFVRKVRAQ